MWWAPALHKKRAAGPGMWAASGSWLEKGSFFQHLQHFGVTQILTLAVQGPSWPWGPHVCVGV